MGGSPQKERDEGWVGPQSRRRTQRAAILAGVNAANVA
jgi:hypothetical protein